MLELSWNSGGEARLQTISGDRVCLLSTVPSPPGSRLAGSAGGLQIQLKVLRCSRGEDDRFTIDGRLLNATRALRRQLESLVTEPE